MGFDKTKLELCRIAIAARGEHDDNWSKGFWLPDNGWLGHKLTWKPWLPALWCTLMILKAVVCILLGRTGDHWPKDDKEDPFIIAVWGGVEHNGYPEANFHEWWEMTVPVGFGPSRWAISIGRESS